MPIPGPASASVISSPQCQQRIISVLILSVISTPSAACAALRKQGTRSVRVRDASTCGWSYASLVYLNGDRTVRCDSVEDRVAQLGAPTRPVTDDGEHERLVCAVLRNRTCLYHLRAEVLGTSEGRSSKN